MAIALAQKNEVKTEQIDINKTVRDKALEVASSDAETANKIIEAFNQAKFNLDGMSVDDINSRVDMVAGIITGYKPPVDTTAKLINGKPVQVGTKSDPFGIDAIVAEVAAKKSTNNYSL